MAVIDNLVAYWSLDEASGTRNDSKGSNNLTDNNTVTSATGKVGTAAQFTAANTEYLSIADNADLSNASSFAFSAWVKTATGGNLGVVSKWGGANNEHACYLGAGKSQMQVNDSVAGTSIAFSAVTVNDDAWHFLLFQYDQSDKKPRIYVDDGSEELAVSALSNGPIDSTSSFYIGTLAGAFLYNGLIDEVGFWKKVLTPTERTWLYNAGAGRSYADIVAEAGGIFAPYFYRQHIGRQPSV